MSKKPDSYDAEIFRTFLARFMSLQKQLNPNYNIDEILRDLLLSSVELPAVEVTIRDRTSKTNQQPLNRIANQLSDMVRSARSSSPLWTEDNLEEHDFHAKY